VQDAAGANRSPPEIGVLMHYEERVVRVMAEARGQRAIIESLDEDGRAFRSAVKWKNLRELPAQLFGRCAEPEVPLRDRYKSYFWNGSTFTSSDGKRPEVRAKAAGSGQGRAPHIAVPRAPFGAGSAS